MINENLNIEKREASESKPLPENIYQVELLDVTSKNEESFNSKKARKENPSLAPVNEDILSFQFVLLGGKDKDGSSLRGRSTWANFVPTYLYNGKNGKNKLYQITEALLGHELTLEEEAHMDGSFINGLVGKQCRVGIKNKVSGDKTYSNIETYYNSETDQTPLTSEEKTKATPKNNGEVSQDTSVMEEVINPDDIPF